MQVVSIRLGPFYLQGRDTKPHCKGDWMGCLDGTEYLAAPEFDPRTVQPVTNCYTDYKIPAVDCNRKPHEFRHQHYSFLGLPKRFYFYESRVGTYPANPYLRNATAVEVWGIDCACRMKCTRLEHRKVMRLKRLRTSYLLRGLRDVQEKPVRRISIMLK